MVKSFRILLCFVSFYLQAQADLNELINLNSTDGLQGQQMLLAWEDLKSNPLAINFCSREELLSTGLINVFQCHNLIQYREQTGAILSAKELILVKGFGAELIKLLTPFLDFRTAVQKPSFSKSAILNFAKHDLLWRWQMRAPMADGFLNGKYLGDPLESRLRYQFQSRNGLGMALNLQKDPGEKWQGPFLFDHASFYLHFRGEGALRQIVLGDFQFQFGQGLSLWSGSAFDANAIGANFNRHSNGLRRSAGNVENRFFRGLALEYQYKKWNSQLFLSNRQLDAKVENIDGRPYFQTQSTGYHRSETELAAKDQINLKSAGFRTLYAHYFFDIALLGHIHHFEDPPVASDYLYDQIAPKRQSYAGLSLHLNLLLGNYHITSEIALSETFKSAFFISWQKKINDKLSLRQAIQKYHSGYRSFWNAPPAISGRSGEFNLKQQLDINWSWLHQSAILYQFAKFPWPRYQIDGPSSSHMVQAFHRWRVSGKQVDFRLRFTNALYYETEEESGLFSPQKSNELQARLIFRLDLAAGLKSRTMVQVKSIPLFKQWLIGSMASQQWVYNYKDKWRHTFRLALSDLPPELGSLYDYEPDLIYGFSIPPLSQQHIRLSLLSRWKRGRLTWEGKLAYAQRLETNKSSWELKFQCRFQI